MSDQLGSELMKLRTTRTAGLIALAAAGLTLLGVCIEGLSPATAELGRETTQRTMLSATTSAVFFATLAGVVVVTSEFRYGTIRPTLLFQPRRRVVLGAKLAAAALAGVALAVVCVALAFGAGLTILAARGVEVVVTAPHVATLVFGTMAASALSAMAGVAIGTLIRGQAAAIGAVAAYAFLVDAVLFSAAPSLGRFLPGKAGDALAGRPVDDLLSPGAGAAVLAAWALAFALAALVRSERSDV